MSKQKSFMFYLDWEELLLELDTDEERWNFVQNAINYHKGTELNFATKMVKLVWMSKKIVFETNKDKWEKSAERSRVNGKKHTGKKPSPNDIIKKITQQVIQKPTEPVKRKKLNGNSEMINGNSQMINVKNQMSNENGKELKDKNQESNVFDDESHLNTNSIVYNTRNTYEKLESIENWEEKLRSIGSGTFIDQYEKGINLTTEDKIEIARKYNSYSSTRE